MRGCRSRKVAKTTGALLPAIGLCTGILWCTQQDGVSIASSWFLANRILFRFQGLRTRATCDRSRTRIFLFRWSHLVFSDWGQGNAPLIQRDLWRNGYPAGHLQGTYERFPPGTHELSLFLFRFQVQIMDPVDLEIPAPIEGLT